MRFMIFVIDNRGSSATDEEMVAINAFNEQLQTNDHWVTAGGLAIPSEALLIDNRDGVGISLSASLNQGSDFYSGFWLIQAKDMREAEDLALQGSKACNRRVELRPLL
jgi:hypothetical protein